MSISGKRTLYEAPSIIGVSKISQFEQLVAATAITLDEEDVNYLAELYRPVENLLNIGTS